MRFQVVGRVLPERAAVGFEPVVWTAPDGVTVSVNCSCSQVNVCFDWPNPPDLLSIFYSAEHVAEAVVAAFGLALGTGYTVEMLQLIDSYGQAHVYGVRPGGLEFRDVGDVFQKAQGLARDDVLFRFALRDYMSAIRSSTDCAAYCYRAVESLKLAIESNSGRAENGWTQLHNIVNKTRDEFDGKIKKLAMSPLSVENADRRHKHGCW